MHFSPGFWIAQRFSFARKRFRVINIISAISFIGIVIGVSTLLIVMSVLNGFQDVSRNLFLTIESPAQLLPQNAADMEVNESLYADIGKIQGVTAVEPFIEGSAVLSGPEKSELVVVKGISSKAQARLMQQTGREISYFGPTTVSVGTMLARKTRLEPGHEVKMYSPELIALGLESLSQPYLLPALTFPVVTVQSIFSLQQLFNDRYVLASAGTARKILLLDSDRYSGIDVRCNDDSASRTALVTALRDWIDKNGLEDRLVVRSLEDKYRDVFAVMEIEKWVSFSILMLVILVAAMSLTGSLTMTAIDKRRELFYLRCLGLEKPQFLMIFVIEGGMIGLAGTFVGVLIAWIGCSIQDRFGFLEMPSKSAFIIDAYPVSMQTVDFLVVSLATLSVSLLVSLYPAFTAARIAGSKSLSDKAN